MGKYVSGTIKPLVWDVVKGFIYGSGSYEIIDRGDPLRESRRFQLTLYSIFHSNHPSLEAAKSAAQADYEARVAAQIDQESSGSGELLDHAMKQVGNVDNFYGGIWIKRESGIDYWCIEDLDGFNWEFCPPNVADALRTLQDTNP